MADSVDDTGFSETREPRKLSPRKRHDLELPSDDEDLPARIVHLTRFPGTMLATSILWIMAGAAYIALFSLLRLLQVPFQGSDLWLILGAFFFIKDGIQLIRGTFRDPLADGIISVLLGLYFLGQGWDRFDTAIGEFIVSAFFGAIFLAPGILVFIGRKQYLAWKAEQEG